MMPYGPHGILQLVATLTAKGMSGRLNIIAGMTEGALLFKDGKLVDARVGHLTGFQAINAVTSMPDARYEFDPAAAVPASSSITSSERFVLKQFFGIETFEPREEPAPLIADDLDETTLVPSRVTTTPTPTVATYPAPSRPPYVIAFAVGVMVVAIAAAAVLLRYRTSQRSAPAAVATSIAPVSPPVPAAAIKSETQTAKAGDLTGEWNVVNTVSSTSYRDFRNLKIGFALSINQTGKTFTGAGQKISENGRSLPASSRTPIRLKGVINGDRIEATFSEDGATRKTNGRFVWKIDRSGGGLTGTFASSAARSSGKSTARRDL